MSSISNSLSTSASQFLALLNPTSTTGNTNSLSPLTSTSQDSTSGISPFAKLLSKLEGLSQTDPSKFKSLTAQIASQLTAAAGSTTGSQAQALTGLASKFTQASQDGNISALQPQQSTQNSGGHHHHHHGGGGAYSASASYSTDQTTDTQSVLQTIFNEVQSA